MKSVLGFALAAVLAACSPGPAPAPRAAAAPPAAAAPTQEDPHKAAVDALGHVYELGLVDGKGDPCLVKLDQDDVDAGPAEVRLAWVQPGCHAQLPILEKLARWTPTAGGSLNLLDKDNQELADFSPVQDGTGVYLRGGDKSGKVYELRTPEW